MRCFRVCALEKFHGDVRLLVTLADLVNRANVGVVESGSGSRFPSESLQGLGVLRQLIGQEFQRDEAAKLGVLGLIDHAHSAATELLHDAIVRDGLADHWERMLRCQIRQVNESRGVGAIPNVFLQRRHFYSPASRSARTQLANLAFSPVVSASEFLS